jgi:hypothetical protein
VTGLTNGDCYAATDCRSSPGIRKKETECLARSNLLWQKISATRTAGQSRNFYISFIFWSQGWVLFLFFLSLSVSALAWKI